jgi:hypothetical protein
LLASGALDFGPGAGGIDGKILSAIRAFEINFHIGLELMREYRGPASPASTNFLFSLVGVWLKAGEVNSIKKPILGWL